MNIIQHLGFNVPNNISIIGFTNGILFKFSEPRLTTVAQHGDRMGEQAAQLLINRMEWAEEVEESFKTDVINATLIKQGSTIN